MTQRITARFHILAKRFSSGGIVALFVTAILLSCGTFHDCAAERKSREDCTLGFLLAAIAQPAVSSSSSGSTGGFSNATVLLGGLLYCETLVSSACAPDE